MSLRPAQLFAITEQLREPGRRKPSPWMYPCGQSWPQTALQSRTEDCGRVQPPPPAGTVASGCGGRAEAQPSLALPASLCLMPTPSALASSQESLVCSPRALQRAGLPGRDSRLAVAKGDLRGTVLTCDEQPHGCGLASRSEPRAVTLAVLPGSAPVPEQAVPTVTERLSDL